MLDRTDFASWQQRIRLYYRGEENGVNILKSIDEGPFQMGTFRETLAEGNEAVKLNRGLRDSNYDQLYAYPKQHEAHINENKMMLDRFTQHIIDPFALMSNVSHQRVVVQNVQGRQNRGQGNNARGAGTTAYVGAQNRVGNANPGQARLFKCYNCNGMGHTARNFTQPKRPQNLKYFKDTMLLMQAQENGVALDEEQLLFIADGQDNDVDEDVPDHENYQDVVCEHHKVHEMHDNVQPNYGVASHTNYANDSNMIPYDQYVKDNTVSVVQSNVSSVPNDAYMMIINEMHEPSTLSVSMNRQHKVVNESLTAELATYKEQVELYERRAKFELTEREQKVEEQLE
uniref:Retrovirus-related Pol polyprotein from transposon TNT 1-94 n=1 Tax=Tanacetum cinerariifolium TaxID=118510 RepID=A0A6L2NFI0_TANCI|nr:retrovirus-related Pol polyprotein from transposon TNT 1-94 [Tanacetum cinerariifolium]